MSKKSLLGELCEKVHNMKLKDPPDPNPNIPDQTKKEMQEKIDTLMEPPNMKGETK